MRRHTWLSRAYWKDISVEQSLLGSALLEEFQNHTEVFQHTVSLFPISPSVGPVCFINQFAYDFWLHHKSKPLSKNEDLH